MKKLSEEEIRRLDRLVKRRTEKRLLRQRKTERDKLRAARLRNIRKARYFATSSPIYSLDVPENLSLDTNYDQVVSLVEDLRYIALTRRMRVGMNFAHVSNVGSAAAL
jgi:hypothetical protein